MSKIQTNQIQHTANGAAVYTLPQTDGSAGQVLRTDGSGNLSWVNDSGKILQVVSFVNNSAASVSISNVYANNSSYIYPISSMDTAITTTQTNSKLLISFNIFGEGTYSVFSDMGAAGNEYALESSSDVNYRAGVTLKF